MASWVGFARKHNPNPKTKAQERESNHGGKLADDHFQRLFLGGALKRAVVTTQLSAATADGADKTLGVGAGDIYTIYSANVDEAPVMLFSADNVIYNGRTSVVTVGTIINVVDTGRFFVLVV